MRKLVAQIAATIAVAASARAQTVAVPTQPPKGGQEFTRQGLLITNFAVGPGADLRLGRRAADAVRSRVAKLSNKKEVDVISGDLIRLRTDHAGYDPDTTFTLETIFTIGKSFRADEYVNGVVSNSPKGFRLEATMVLMRDKRLRQPLQPVTAAKLDDAAELMAKQIAAAHAQVIDVRRCENALRAHDGAGAIVAARHGVTLYPNATIARICLAWAFEATHSPSDQLLKAAREVLAVDPESFHAIEAAAVALDSLRQTTAAADLWLRLAATDTSDLELAQRVIFSLVADGNAKRAEPLVLSLAAGHPDNIPLIEQKWHVTFATKNWPAAIEAGESMLVHDSVARADSVFWLRLGTAYQGNKQPFKAIETLSHGVSAFPNDARMYTLYTQYIKAESDTVIARGLALHPESAELHALNAKDLRARGKLQESLDATRRAVSLDSTMSQGELMVAQLEMDLGRPDSALASLRRALGRGEDSTIVGQFALAKGNALYRAANGTHTSPDFALSLRFLSFADSVKSSVQSRFLIGAAALGLSQAALTEAPKLTDKSESCRLAKLGADMIPIARVGLEAGQEAYGDAAKQSLDYLTQLDPVVSQQLTAFCGTGH